MFAGVTVIAAMGVITYVLFVLIERRFTGWATRRSDAPLATSG
jgi:NitT/TauT family transport system permease protein